VVNAVGVFPDGTVFENTYKSKKPLTMVTSNMIPGLNETVQLMPEGSLWRIFIPSKLAYGEKGLPGIIPPNTALVYEVSLEKVKEGKR
jgi:FKBP-type peptidyl-prolyl cis-trans isomerase